jgi:rhodanese-related sulfurtransferase
VNPISRDQLQEMEFNKNDFVLVNVLSHEQFNKEHIRNSINIPLETKNFTNQVENVIGNKDRDVVVYCASFDCNASPKAAQKLDEAGFKNVYDYEGGMKDWMEG